MTATEQAFDLASERGELEAMTMNALKRRYRQVSGHDSRTRNRQYLVRRILWLLQAAAHGGLSQEALARAAERISSPGPASRSGRCSAYPSSAATMEATNTTIDVVSDDMVGLVDSQTNPPRVSSA